MWKAHNRPGRLKAILRGYGLSKSATKRFTAMVEHLITTRGVRGCYLYLDALGQKIFSDLTGEPVSPPVWVDLKPWRRLTRKTKRLYKMMTKIKRFILLDDVTESQWEKFHTASTRDEPSPDAIKEAKRFISLGIESLLRLEPDTPNSGTMEAWPLYAITALTREAGDLSLALDRASKTLSADLISAEENGWFKTQPELYHVFRPFTPREIDLYIETVRNNSDLNGVGPHVGYIGFSQEGGAKLRIYGSPRKLWQARLNGMYQHAMDWLQVIENDYCHDQSGAADVIRQALTKGLLVDSVDLSSCTDALPWDIQKYTLSRLHFKDSDIACLEFLSRERWKLPDELIPFAKGEFHRWTVGQPLGTKPSFAVFSLTLHALIRGICVYLGIRRDFPYAQLGDDHASWDHRVSVMFRSIITSLGVEVSESKSITSDKTAEFAGYTITSDEAFRPGKWKPVESENILAYAADPEFRYENCLPKTVVKLLNKLLRLPYPKGLSVPQLETLEEDEVKDIIRNLTIGLRRPAGLSKFRLREALAHMTVLSLFPGHVSTHVEKWTLYIGELQVKSPGEWFSPSRERRMNVRQREALTLSTLRMAEVKAALSDDYKVADFDVAFPLLHHSLWDEAWLDHCDPMADHFVRIIGTLIYWGADKQGYFTVTRACQGSRWLTGLAARRRVSSLWELVAVILEDYPYFDAEDFHIIEGTFFRLLRRVADGKDIIPTRLVEMPVRTG